MAAKKTSVMTSAVGPRKQSSMDGHSSGGRVSKPAMPDVQIPMGGDFYRAFVEACRQRGIPQVMVLKQWPRRTAPPESAVFPEMPRSPSPTASLESLPSLSNMSTLFLQSKSTGTGISTEGGDLLTIPTTRHDDSDQASVVMPPISERDLRVPRIFFELDQPDNGDSVVRVLVRDWQIDKRMFDVFEASFVHLEKLFAVNLWNTAVRPKTLKRLVRFLENSTIREFHLDCNPLPDQEDFAVFLKPPLHLQSVSFRYCNITDVGAKAMASTLGSISEVNTTLVNLNLTGNSIGDCGAQYFAQALRMNRALVSLSLAGNKVGDSGCFALAEALSESRLTRAELCFRRNLIYNAVVGNFMNEKSNAEEYGLHKGEDRKRRMSSVQQTAAVAKSRGAKDSRRESEKKSPPFKSPEITEFARKGLKDPNANAGSQKTDDFTITPDMIVIHRVKTDKTGLLFMTGNFSLANLNLAMNCITSVGMKALLKAVVYQQQEILPLTKEYGTGLMRMKLEGNLASDSNRNYLRLVVLLKSLDPIARYIQQLYDQIALEQASSLRGEEETLSYYSVVEESSAKGYMARKKRTR